VGPGSDPPSPCSSTQPGQGFSGGPAGSCRGARALRPHADRDRVGAKSLPIASELGPAGPYRVRAGDPPPTRVRAAGVKGGTSRTLKARAVRCLVPATTQTVGIGFELRARTLVTRDPADGGGIAPGAFRQTRATSGAEMCCCSLLSGPAETQCLRSRVLLRILECRRGRPPVTAGRFPAASDSPSRYPDSGSTRNSVEGVGSRRRCRGSLTSTARFTHWRGSGGDPGNLLAHVSVPHLAGARSDRSMGGAPVADSPGASTPCRAFQGRGPIAESSRISSAPGGLRFYGRSCGRRHRLHRSPPQGLLHHRQPVLWESTLDRRVKTGSFR